MTPQEQAGYIPAYERACDPEDFFPKEAKDIIAELRAKVAWLEQERPPGSLDDLLTTQLTQR